MDIKTFIDEYKSLYEDGLTDSEILDILEMFPNIDKTKFTNKLLGNTVMLHTCKTTGNNILVNYKCDVIYALYSFINDDEFIITLRNFKINKIKK